MSSTTYVVKVVLPGKKRGGSVRDQFFAWVWNHLKPVGVHEGTILAKDATKMGLLTESFAVDAAQAPHWRDWVGNNSESAVVEIYFAKKDQAQKAAAQIPLQMPSAGPLAVQKILPENWNKKSQSYFKGAVIKPYWRVVPGWKAPTQKKQKSFSKKKMQNLVLNPGAGFGTGTHPTTQLCLRAIGALSRIWAEEFPDFSVLDFGSGSGILSVAAAISDAKKVVSVEIDPLAIENARFNAKLNHVEKKILFKKKISPKQSNQKFQLVVANILRPVLLTHSQQLVSALDRSGPYWALILSGLVKNDLGPITQKYTKLLSGSSSPLRPYLLQSGEWYALIWISHKIRGVF